MKYHTFFLTASLLFFATFHHNIIGSERVPHADNYNQLQNILADVQTYIHDEMIAAYPKIKKVGTTTKVYLVQFHDDDTVEYNIQLRIKYAMMSKHAVMNKDVLLSGEIARTSLSIHLSPELLHQLQQRQSSRCIIL